MAEVYGDVRGGLAAYEQRSDMEAGDKNMNVANGDNRTCPRLGQENCSMLQACATIDIQDVGDSL